MQRTVAALAAFSKAIPKSPNVVVAGVTGAVGEEFLACLERRKFPINKLKLLASARSVGKEYTFRGQKLKVEEMKEDSFAGYDIALFSAGGAQSKKYAPCAVKAHCVVVDNSSFFRMHPDVPLVVPEINPEAARGHAGIIANPNCSTIIMNLAVWPIHTLAPVSRIVVSTYQAASGAGAAAMREVEQQARDWAAGKPLQAKIFPRPLLFNLFSHNSKMDEQSGYNEEEVKMIKETHKIFGTPNIGITATCVRVPVLRAHCESINLTLSKPVSEAAIRAALAKAPGVKLLDDRQQNRFPEPNDASGQDDIVVGRIRPDNSQPSEIGYNLFVSGDQLLKGAALNAVQIAELLL